LKKEMPMRKSLLSVALLAAAFALGIADPKPEILVFGAASLTESLRDLGKAYEAASGTKVIFSFGASSDLARQIQAGAPADVVFSADTAKMDALEKAGLVRAGGRREFLSNSLVVVVPSDSTLEISTPEELTNLPRIAIADPASVPAGIYAKRWLMGLGLWEKIEPRVVPTLDVRAALAAVESGAISAAIVYRTDAAVAKSARVAFWVANGPEILYSVAPIATSRNPKAAEAFAQFLAGPDGRAEFTKRGFVVRDAK
jgi:molybdate transport system substrate-binding protein